MGTAADGDLEESEVAHRMSHHAFATQLPSHNQYAEGAEDANASDEGAARSHVSGFTNKSVGEAFAVGRAFDLAEGADTATSAAEEIKS